MEDSESVSEKNQSVSVFKMSAPQLLSKLIARLKAG